MSGYCKKYDTKAGKRWRVIYDGPPDPETGKRRQRQKRGFTRERDAQRFLRDQLAKVEDGTYVARSTQTLAEYLRDALDGMKLRDTARANYEGAARYVIPRIGGVKLQALTPEHLDKLYRELERHGKRAGKCSTAGVTCREHGCKPERHAGLAPKSVRHVHTCLHRVLAEAVKRGHLPRNVASLANPPTQEQAKSKKAKDGVWTAEQLGTFLRHVASDRLYAAWVLVCTTGMRRAEILGLRWKDVDLKAGTLTIAQTVTVAGNKLVWQDQAKTKAGARTVALDPATVAALHEHRKRQPDEREAAATWCDDEHGPLVFTDEHGAVFQPDRFLRTLRRHADACGLPRTDVHGLRHAYATAALHAGVNVEVLSARLGHASPSITLDVYSHVLDGDDAQAAATVATAIFGKEAAQ